MDSPIQRTLVARLTDLPLSQRCGTMGHLSGDNPSDSQSTRFTLVEGSTFTHTHFQHCSKYVNVFQHCSAYFNICQHCVNTSQHISTLFDIVQHISTSFNIFQHGSTSLNIFQHVATCSTCFNMCQVKMLQHISTSFN